MENPFRIEHEAHFCLEQMMASYNVTFENSDNILKNDVETDKVEIIIYDGGDVDGYYPED